MTSTSEPDRRSLKSGPAVAALLFGAIAISLAPILVRFSTLEPVVSAFYRLALALPFFMILPALAPSRPTAELADLTGVTLRDAALMFLCGAMLAADLALWHLSITMTSVANATLFNNCAPVILLILGWAVFGERITREVLLALVVAGGGMSLLIGENFVVSPDQFLGDAVAVSTAFFYAIYLFLVKSLRSRYDTFAIMTGTSLASALCLLLVSLTQGWSFTPDGLQGWMIVLGLAVICHVIGQSLIAQALAYLPVSISSFGLLLQPVSAAVLAWLLFNEALSTLQILGGLLVLCGIVLSNRARISGK
jgi:drug/metabolite transporter (DMT)-like permease